MTINPDIVNLSGRIAIDQEPLWEVPMKVPPTFLSINPITGVITGGTLVDVYGTGFSGSTWTQVLFGGVQATGVSVIDDGHITCLTPVYPAASVVDVEIRNSFGYSVLPNAFTYTFSFTLSGISPTHGPWYGETPLTISGTGLSMPTIATLGNPLTSIIVVNPNTITAKPQESFIMPPSTATLSIVIPPYSQTLPNCYTFDSPIVNSISPLEGPMGASIQDLGGGVRRRLVTARGSGYIEDSLMSWVSNQWVGYWVFCATSSQYRRITSNTSVRLNVTPSWSPLPTVGSYYFILGTPITFTGSLFKGINPTTFDAFWNTTPNAYSTRNTVVNNTTLTCIAPLYNNAVDNSCVDFTFRFFGPIYSGPTFHELGFTYTYRIPQVLSIFPVIGSTGGGTFVTITGNFFTNSVAQIHNAYLTGVTLVDENTITGTTTPHSAGTYPVVVSGIGCSGVLPGVYTYV